MERNVVEKKSGYRKRVDAVVECGCYRIEIEILISEYGCYQIDMGILIS